MVDEDESVLVPVPIVLEPLVVPLPMLLEPLIEPLPVPVAELLELGEVVVELELELGVVLPLLIDPVPVVPLPLVVDEGLVDDVPEPLVVPVVLLVPLPLMLPPWLGATVAPLLPWSTGVAPGPDWLVVLVLPPAPVPVPLDWANATPATAASDTAAARAVFLKLLMLELLFRIDEVLTCCALQSRCRLMQARPSRPQRNGNAHAHERRPHHAFTAGCNTGWT